MSLSQIVDVQITRDTQVPSRVGFGVPMLLAYHNLWADRVRLIGDAQELLDAGANETDAVFLAALAGFAQSPKPPQIAIGRRANPFTMRVQITPLVTTAGEVIAFTATAPNGTSIEVEHVIPNGATIDSICDALIAQLDPLVDVNVGSGVAQVATLTPTNTAPGYVYTFTITVDDVETTITHTNGGSETATTICDAFRTQINAITGTTVAATGTATCVITSEVGKSFVLGTMPGTITVVDGDTNTSVILTAANPGEIFDLSALPHANTGILDVQVTTPDPGVAADFNACMAVGSDLFYAFTLEHASQAQIEALDSVVQATKKLAVYGVSDREILDSGVTDDVASGLKLAGFFRSATFTLCNRISGHHAFALLCRWLPYTPGSETVAYKTIVGVLPDRLTSSQVTTAIGAEGVQGKWTTIYTRTGGVNVAREGHVPDGDYLDTIRGVDWLEARIAEDVFALLTRLDKIPFTDTGIALVVGALRSRLQNAVDVGLLASYDVSYPKAADVDPADKARRTLPDLNFTATLAGAIHRMKIRGKVSI